MSKLSEVRAESAYRKRVMSELAFELEETKAKLEEAEASSRELQSRIDAALESIDDADDIETAVEDAVSILRGGP